MRATDGMRTKRRDFLRILGTAVGGLALSALPYAARGAAASLKIGIIGSGRIGGTLGEIWLKAGHEVMFSSRHLDDDQALAARLGGKARAGTPQQAAAFGEVLLFAVPYGALPELGRTLASEIKGKPAIDACNPFVGRDGEIASWARSKGAGLASAELLPGAQLVRAFNAISYARLPAAAERKPGDRIGMPMAGDDPDAIAVASRLVRDAGFEPVVVGPLAMGRYLIPGTPLAGEHSAEEIRKIAAGLN
jgi:8-hydroxy-5-deazaflavin:NADPH oxidoreductase